MRNYTLNVCMYVGGWSCYGFHNLSWGSSVKDTIKFWCAWWAIPMVSFLLTCWNKNSTVNKGLIMITAQRQCCSRSSSIEHAAFESVLCSLHKSENFCALCLNTHTVQSCVVCNVCTVIILLIMQYYKYN